MKIFNKNILAAMVGNAMEWYDYILYGHFVYIIGRIFFPLENEFYSKFLALSVLAIGFLTRPLGGFIFGKIGDKLGRKSALTSSMLLMAIPTALISILPGFEVIGILAPVLILIIRIMQGIALGGENTSAMTYLFESSAKNRIFTSSLAPTALLMGVLMASLTILILENIFTKTQIEEFAWRIPFAISIVYSSFGVYIRKKLYETIDFEKIKKEGAVAKTPFKEVFKNHKRAIFTSMAAAGATSVPFYITLVFSKTIFLQNGMASKTITLLNFLAVALCTILIPVFGFIAERTDLKKVLICGFLGMSAFSFPFLYFIESASVSLAIIASLGAGFFIAMQGPLPPFYAKSFPANIRASGISFSFNIPAALLGGTAPMVVATILNYTGSIIPIGFYLSFISLVGAVGIYYGKFID